MRWLIVLCVGALGCAVFPFVAEGYSVPSGLTPGSYQTLCPPRPGDLGGALASPVIADAGAGTALAVSTSRTFTGTALGGIAYLAASSNFPMGMEVSAQDGAGAWHIVYKFSGNNPQLNASFTLPSGPVRMVVTDTSATVAGTYYASLVDGQPASAGTVTLQQEIADGCYRGEQLATTAHNDAGSIDGDVQAVTAAVMQLESAPTGSHTTFASLMGQLQTLDTDVRAVTSAVQALPGPGSASGTPQLVQLSSADRQLQADVGSGTNGDLWVVVGTILGAFAGIEILRRVLP